MKFIKLIGLLVLAAIPALGNQCSDIVYDETGTLNPEQVQTIQNASGPLVNQGADVRVRVVAATDNLDMVIKSFTRDCTDWSGASGGMKNTLLVLAVSPASRKLGLYYGAAWHNALDNHWNRIKTDYMVPHFRDKDWTGGFVAAEQQLTARLVASKDEATHPIVATTTNQATDLSGLWTVFGWGLGLLAFGLVIYGGYAVYIRRKKTLQEAKDAQTVTGFTKARAAKLIVDIGNKIKFAEAATPPPYHLAKAKAFYDSALTAFSTYNDSAGLDPDQIGLTYNQYYAIRMRYEEVINTLKNAEYYLNLTGTEEVPPPPAAPQASATAAGSSYVPTYKHDGRHHHHSSSSVFSPIIVDNSTTNEYSGSNIDESPSREDHSSSSSDDSGGGSSGWSSSDDSSSGGSSSWSSDSSSSDSGGSSSFDSGGSFGGGGSSDF